MKKIIIDKKIICGIDEAGRGSWAGPVVSAAVILKNYPDLNHLNDSKILTSEDLFIRKKPPFPFLPVYPSAIS